MNVLKNTIIGIVLIFCIITNLHSQQNSSVLLNNDILVIKTEGIAFLGSGMSEDDAKTFSISDAKRNALEQAGTYLESNTTVLNYQLVKDEIITFTGGLLKVQVFNEERTLINNMFAIKVNIEATIDISLLDASIKKSQEDSGVRRQLEAERERNKQLEAKIADLQASGSTALKQDVKIVIDKLSAAEWYNKGYNTADDTLKIDYYTKAIELDPKYVSAYEERGYAYFKLGDTTASIQDFKKVIELAPQYVTGYRKLGAIYLWSGDLTAGIQMYNKAIELNPQNKSNYPPLSSLYDKLTDHAAAIQIANKFIEEFPQEWVGYVNRGRIYFALSNYEVAFQDFNKAIELCSYDEEKFGVYLFRGNAYAALGNHAEALEDYNKVVELSPDLFIGYLIRGHGYYVLGNYTEAIQDCNKTIELEPYFVRAYRIRGDAYKTSGNDTAAAQDYKKAEEIQKWLDTPEGQDYISTKYGESFNKEMDEIFFKK